MQLDRIDLALLDALRKNARLPNKTLAGKVGVAPSTALERVRRLRESGVIQGYHAEIDPSALGIGLQAMISVRLERHARTDVAAFDTHLKTLPEVLSFWHVAGGNDFLVHVAVADSQRLRDFALDAFTTRKEVAHIETNLIFSFQRNARLPTVNPVPRPRDGGR